MSEFTCPTCGNRLQGDEPCAACNAVTAIATPKDAAKAKVTPPTKDHGTFRAGSPPAQLRLPSVRRQGGRVLFWAIWSILLFATIYSCLLVLRSQAGR